MKLSECEKELKRNKLLGLEKVRETVEAVRQFRDLSWNEYLLLKRIVGYVSKYSFLPRSYARMLRNMRAEVEKEFSWKE